LKRPTGRKAGEERAVAGSFLPHEAQKIHLISGT
jgi:hypothetical protein